MSNFSLSLSPFLFLFSSQLRSRTRKSCIRANSSYGYNISVAGVIIFLRDGETDRGGLRRGGLKPRAARGLSNARRTRYEACNGVRPFPLHFLWAQLRFAQASIGRVSRSRRGPYVRACARALRGRFEKHSFGTPFKWGAEGRGGVTAKYHQREREKKFHRLSQIDAMPV